MDVGHLTVLKGRAYSVISGGDGGERSLWLNVACLLLAAPGLTENGGPRLSSHWSVLWQQASCN